MDLLQTFFNVDVLVKSMPALFRGLGITALLGFTSLVIAIVLGVALVLLRLYAYRPVRIITIAWIDVLRSIPLLVMMVVIYYAFPYIGVRLSPFWAAAAALSVVASAYFAETFRAGIEAIPEGQFEASRALGFSWWRMMVDVIWPQAVPVAIPGATGFAISLMKDTSLASVVALPDLLKQATQTQAFYANPTPLIGAAILYLLLLLPLVRAVSAVEERQRKRGART